MFTRTDINKISKKLSNTSVEESVADQVSDLIDTCYDAQAGIRACGYMEDDLKYTLEELELEPHNDLYEAVELLNTAAQMFDIEFGKPFDYVQSVFLDSLQQASDELYDLIEGTDLELPRLLGWEDYPQWDLERSKLKEELDYMWEVDADMAYAECQKIDADLYFEQPLMWFFNYKVDQDRAKSNKIDDLRTYIAKNTTHEIYRQRFADYA